MTTTRSFHRGGVCAPPASHCEPAMPVQNAALPSQAILPLRQHAGEPARRSVQVGDLVAQWAVVGRAGGPRSAHVHSPIPGRVVRLEQVSDCRGETCEAVVIDLEGEFGSPGGRSPARSWETAGRFDLLAQVQAAGVVDRGGTCAPAHLALAVEPGREPGRLVVNGVETDPALSCTAALLGSRPHDLVEGIRIAAKMLGLSGGIVLAVGETHSALVPAFERAIDAAGADIGIRVVGSRYPQEHPQLLLAALDGRRAEHGRGRSKPASRDVILSAAAVLAVYEAVVLAKPFTEGIVTVSGSVLASPRNLKVRFGTPAADLADDCGGLLEEPGAVVLGGAMTGRVAPSPAAPVTKETTAVIFLSREQARAMRSAPCIGCGRCIDSCPWGLGPTRLFKLLTSGREGQARAEGLDECSGCGCCSAVCPSRIELTRVLDSGRAGGPLHAC